MKQLSQEEIDLLLDVRNRMGEDDQYDLEKLETLMQSESERRVLPYNFKRPRLFSQDQMRVLNYAHESFARDLSVYLSAQLRTIVDIQLTAIDQVLYSEYVMSSAPPSALFVAEERNLAQMIIAEIDPRLCIFTIEKLFGGQGQFLKGPRELSQIERRIMSKVMRRFFSELAKAWKQAHEVLFEEVAFETNAEFVQILPGVEPTLVCTFEVLIYETRSFLNLCYPYLLLEKMLGRAGLRRWISGNTVEVSPEVRRRFEHRVKAVDMEMRVELGRASLSVRDVNSIRVGDVITLNQNVHTPLNVSAGKDTHFTAFPGKSGNRVALRIQEVVSRPDYFMDDNA